MLTEGEEDSERRERRWKERMNEGRFMRKHKLVYFGRVRVHGGAELNSLIDQSR